METERHAQCPRRRIRNGSVLASEAFGSALLHACVARVCRALPVGKNLSLGHRSGAPYGTYVSTCALTQTISVSTEQVPYGQGNINAAHVRMTGFLRIIDELQSNPLCSSLSRKPGKLGSCNCPKTAKNAQFSTLRHAEVRPCVVEFTWCAVFYLYSLNSGT